MARAGTAQDSSPFLGLHSESRDPTSLCKADAARPREGKALPGSDSDSITTGYPSSQHILVLAPDQLLDIPPRTSGALTHPPFPSPHPQLGRHITCHLSIQRPDPCHQRSPGPTVSPQMMLPWVQGGENGAAPHLACPGPGPALQPWAAGLPSGQVLGGSHWPRCWHTSARRLASLEQTRLRSNRCSLCGGEGARRRFPTALFPPGLAQGWALPSGQPVLWGCLRDRAW